MRKPGLRLLARQAGRERRMQLIEYLVTVEALPSQLRWDLSCLNVRCDTYRFFPTDWRVLDKGAGCTFTLVRIGRRDRARYFHPLAKSVIKGYLTVQDTVTEWAAETGEQVSDLVAEARAEHAAPAAGSTAAETRKTRSSSSTGGARK
jgi:hypothetical protein